MRSFKFSKVKKEKVINLVEEITSLEQCIFIVEGKKDVESLVSIGVKKSSIYSISNKPINKVIEDVRGKRVIDFLDNDNEGEKLRKHLKRHNIFLYSRYKDALFYLLKINKTEEIKKKLFKL